MALINKRQFNKKKKTENNLAKKLLNRHALCLPNES